LIVPGASDDLLILCFLFFEHLELHTHTHMMVLIFSRLTSLAGIRSPMKPVKTAGVVFLWAITLPSVLAACLELNKIF